MSKDYYNILGVDKNASQDDIKKAFRKLAHEHHPDKAGGNEDKFKEINEAYQVLGNQQKKEQYDRFGSGFEHGQAGGFQGFGGFRDYSDGVNINFDDLGDIFGGFGDIFGFGGGRTKNRRSRRGSDIEALINIDFIEAVFGIEKEISLKKRIVCKHCHGNGAEPGSSITTCPTCQGKGKITQVQRTILGNIQTQSVCPDCGGTGKKIIVKCSKCYGSGVVNENTVVKVRIPGGIDNGQTIRLSGQGEAGERGSESGDLFLKIKIIPDKRFERRGFDIYSKIYLKFTQAALGAKIEVETVDGQLTLKIPEGTQSGTLFRLRGKGITYLQNRGRGDHIVETVIKTPIGLSRIQKKVLEDLNI
jgi:molecular chaperone DnaJ